MTNSFSVLSWAAIRARGTPLMRYQPGGETGVDLLLLTDSGDPAQLHGSVRWLSENGIVLVPPATLDAIKQWNGQIAIGGYIDRLHVRQGDEGELLIAEVVGRALPLAYRALASRADLRSGRLSIVRERASTADTDEYTYPVLLDPESNFAMLAQDALVSGLAVDLIGGLADDDEMQALDCGLLLTPYALTVYSAG